MAEKKRSNRDLIGLQLNPDDRIRLNDLVKLARRVKAGTSQTTVIKNLILDMHCRIVKAGYLSLLYGPVEQQEPGNGSNGESKTEKAG